MEEQAEILLKYLEDPIKAYIFVVILRNPDITSQEIKQEMHISGTKIFYHLKQMMESDPPLIIESGQQKVTKHLFKRKFRISKITQELVKKHFRPGAKYYHLYGLYLATAIQHQQIRRVKYLMEKGEEPQGSSLMMFIDDEIAEELRNGLEHIFRKCSEKYKEMDRFDALRICRNAAFAGIYQLS
ncbi:MAG: hypothetical protein D6732_06830 [Methanobacteriota archaeon]|nr:MAG: hypothetical protein D6732_06830 [Euryarchaeota archaeon]